MNSTEHLDSAERFAFGKNWAHFLHHLNDDHIAEAEKSLLNMLGLKELQGKHSWILGVVENYLA